MTRRSASQLLDDLESVIDRHRMESRLTYIEIVGVLECLKADILAEMGDNEEIEDRTDGAD